MHTSSTRTLRGSLKDRIFSFNPDAISSQPAFIPIIAFTSSKLCELDECLYFFQMDLKYCPVLTSFNIKCGHVLGE